LVLTRAWVQFCHFAADTKLAIDMVFKTSENKKFMSRYLQRSHYISEKYYLSSRFLIKYCRIGLCLKFILAGTYCILRNLRIRWNWLCLFEVQGSIAYYEIYASSRCAFLPRVIFFKIPVLLGG
jgi:hypothetical protein